MYRAIDAQGPHLVPGHGVSPYLYIFFVFFQIVGSFFLTNVFVGVVISAFNRETKSIGKNFLLSETQQKLVETKMLLLNVKPEIVMVKPENKCREFFYKIATHRGMDNVMLVTILLNILTMCFKWPNMGPTNVLITHILNYIYGGIFVLECVIKLVAFDVRYFKKNWHIFDFILVIVSVISVAMGAYEILTTAQLIRILRLVREVYKFKQLQQLQVIFSTFINTFASLLNVGGLMFLIIYIYAVLSINLFANVKHVDPIDEYLNFNNIGNAFVALITMATGEGWIDVLYALGKSNEDNY
jgi:hypothetical protein